MCLVYQLIAILFSVPAHSYSLRIGSKLLFCVFRQKTLLIQSLSQGKSYQLRVSAGNLYGYGLPALPVAVAIEESVVQKSSAHDLSSAPRGRKVKIDDYDKLCKLFEIPEPIISFSDKMRRSIVYVISKISKISNSLEIITCNYLRTVWHRL